MSVVEEISKRIKHMPKGRPFAANMFLGEGTRTSVDKALSRLVQNGTLERITRGVYMRPKVSKLTGMVRPSPLRVMEVITKANGEKIQLHGSEAVRRLGLSTQMQIFTTYYTSGSTREIRVGNAVVRLQHASNERLQQAGTRVGVVLTALHYIGKEGLSFKMVIQVIKVLSSDELKKLRACKMPEWMRLAVSHAAKDLECLTPTLTSVPKSNTNY